MSRNFRRYHNDLHGCREEDSACTFSHLCAQVPFAKAFSLSGFSVGLQQPVLTSDLGPRFLF